MAERRGMTDELRIEYIPLAHLKRYTKNPKDHDLGLLHASIARFGFTDPMAIDEATGTLVEGHGRLDTLEQQEFDGAPLPRHMKLVDGAWAAPVIRGLSFDSDDERRAYTIGHNQTTVAGGWHDELLIAELADLAQAEVPFDGMGFDLEDLDRMIADQSYQGAMPPPPEPEKEAEPAKPAPPKYGVIALAETAEHEAEIAEILEHAEIPHRLLSESS